MTNGHFSVTRWTVGSTTVFLTKYSGQVCCVVFTTTPVFEFSTYQIEATLRESAHKRNCILIFV
jgi:hypothetical protein